MTDKPPLVRSDEPLKRLGGGRWQTRDERFTIEPQSGTWVVVDAEQTDDLGLPRVRGPFGSLTAAKTAIASAREAEPAVSSLAAKVAEHRERVTATRPAAQGRTNAPPATAASKPKAAPAPARPPEPAPPPEPAWIRALPPDRREAAHDLLDRLEALGVAEAETLVRTEIVGQQPAIAGYALARALASLGPDAKPGNVARLLGQGEAADLGVRWRLVDGDGRPIKIEETKT